MKFLKKYWQFLVVPVVILLAHLFGFAVSPLGNGSYVDWVMMALYGVPIRVLIPLENIVIGDCPGLGFDGGPCAHSEMALAIVLIIIWWLLMTAIVGYVIQYSRKYRLLHSKK